MAGIYKHLFKENGCIFRESNSATFFIASLLNEGQPINSPGSKFFPLGADPFERDSSSGKQIGGHKSYLPLQNDGKNGDVFIHKCKKRSLRMCGIDNTLSASAI